MNISFQKLAGIIMLGGLLSLTGCSSGQQDAAPPAGQAAVQTPAAAEAPQPEASPPAETGSGEAAAPASGGEAAPADPAASGAGGAAATAEPGAAGGTAAAGAAAQDPGKQLKELLELAKQGKVPGVEYAAHSGLIDDVEAAWGEPDTKEAAGKGIYSTYAAKAVVFGFNKGSRVFDVRSSAAGLHKLTLKQIEAALGEPDHTAVNGKDEIYIYQAGEQYQLKFVIPDATGTVDHISVFSEQDSINNMAG
ncbi:YjgB family protein [Paenibacillus sp. MMS20-IR301]|uniref:YjgB family protein n=1 Tax=Paenibacillus sp. MMS20-IR301 TaxID=2895946 RepID=UPI0028EB60CD|nr:YjgB family protein [Paenibacillus sp. MMS20-IR301]WNS41129.1 YjgB family protein [Paenibacillus sp. MMS20-IR301]